MLVLECVKKIYCPPSKTQFLPCRAVWRSSEIASLCFWAHSHKDAAVMCGYNFQWQIHLWRFLHTLSNSRMHVFGLGSKRPAVYSEFCATIQVPLFGGKKKNIGICNVIRGCQSPWLPSLKRTCRSTTPWLQGCSCNRRKQSAILMSCFPFLPSKWCA